MTTRGDLAFLERRHWDVIVVGTGMGGATIGYALAKAGLDVVFCEKGRSLLSAHSTFRGQYPEAADTWAGATVDERRAYLASSGRWSDELEDLSHGVPRRFVPFIGSGTGGSSVLYGMALERLFPMDLTPRDNHPQARESSLPDRWPITYAELQPYYEAAERLFRVRGTQDPLRPHDALAHLPPPLPLTPGAQEFYDFLAAKDLHPYRLPLACEYAPGCPGCQGFLCRWDCKNDGARICLAPALSHHGAYLVDECKVVRLEASRDVVDRVICSRLGQPLTLHGATVVLAAGALETPRILLSSASPRWPNGLANDSGLVGRNLMRHCIDLYVLFQRAREWRTEGLKELAFNDLYCVESEKLGTVQSFGPMPPPSVLFADIERRFRATNRAWLLPALNVARRPTYAAWPALFRGRMVLATILEDLPYPENQVLVASKAARLAFIYRIQPHEARRIKMFRERLRTILKPYRFMLIKQAENNERIAHACGTCRFGRDPATSVLDRTNRTHALSNLYVVDASFFPSSAGTNPGLTIAANALRVAEYVIQAMRTNR